jgi:hypothetical protein
MIEIFNIIIILFINLMIFSTPIFLKMNTFSNDNQDIFKIKVCFNLVFLLNILLIISFIKINFYILLSCILLINLVQLIVFYRSFSFTKKIKCFYLIIFLLSFVLSINLSINLKLEWDASVNWIFKTLNFYNGFAFDNLINIPGIAAYPHLGSFLWAFFWKISIINAEYVGRITFLFFFVFSIILNSYKNEANLYQNLIVTILIAAFFYDQNSFAGYQEGFMFSLIAILFFVTKKIKEFKKINYLSVFFILLIINLLLWIKNEGVVWSLLILGYLFLTIKKKYKFKAFLFFGFLILLSLKYLIFLKFFGENLIGWKGYTFIPLDSNFLITLIERLPFILFSILKVFFKYPFLIITIFLLIIKLPNKENYNLLLFLIASIVIASSIFLITDNEQWKFHTNVGLDRMIYQTCGFYILIISQNLHIALSKIFNSGNSKS